MRVDLCDEALRLAHLVAELMPGQPEVLGLLALLLLTDARRATRADGAGELVLLADQDRARWDRGAIDEGTALAAEAVRRVSGDAGPYLLQALIAGCTPLRRSSAAPRGLDRRALRAAGAGPPLAGRTTQPRRRGRGVPGGSAAGLAGLDALAGLERFHLWHAARAEQLRRLDRPADGAEADRAALTCALAEPERAFLQRRLAAVRPG